MADFDSYKNIFLHAKLIRSSNGVIEVVHIQTVTPWFSMATPTRNLRSFFIRSARTPEIVWSF